MRLQKGHGGGAAARGAEGANYHCGRKVSCSPSPQDPQGVAGSGELACTAQGQHVLPAHAGSMVEVQPEGSTFNRSSATLGTQQLAQARLAAAAAP